MSIHGLWQASLAIRPASVLSDLLASARKIIKKRHIHKKMTKLTEVSSNFCFGGFQKVFMHESKQLGCNMKFGIYLPPAAEERKVPVIYWLSGLTCTEQNFIQKAGAQQYAAKEGVIIVAPDTSPRGCNIKGEDDNYDFGTGAGFYVDATQEPWKKNYRMYSYIVEELPQLLLENFPIVHDKQSIMGHSMGGHGALICALKNPGKYQSVSAFAPICNPIQCNWGKKAFSGYLGSEDNSSWSEWDAVELVSKYNGPPLEIHIDQGKNDEFLESQLHPGNLVEACKKKANGLRTILNVREKYDHSYYFIASFIGDHISYHSRILHN